MEQKRTYEMPQSDRIGLDTEDVVTNSFPGETVSTRFPGEVSGGVDLEDDEW